MYGYVALAVTMTTNYIVYVDFFNVVGGLLRWHSERKCGLSAIITHRKVSATYNIHTDECPKPLIPDTRIAKHYVSDINAIGQ